MFERYTERARRVIFCARYEACQCGSPEIDTEHLLIGLLRESKSILQWVPRLTSEIVRKRIDGATPSRSPLSTSIDLPLSRTSKQVLEFARDEADRLAHRHIGTEHLFLGLLDVEDCFAAKLLREHGAEAEAIRAKVGGQSPPPQPWSFQRASSRDWGFRALSGETVEIHGSRWNVDYVRDAINLVRSYNWYWHSAEWKPRDVVIHRKKGTVSFDLTLAEDSAHFTLEKNGWKKDHCFVCRWELFESDDEHGRGYTNGHDWLCMECYERFWQHPDFFSSSHSEMT
jgi:hypothetical protein